MEVMVSSTDFLFNSGLYSDRGGGCIGAFGIGLNVTVNECFFSGNDGGRGSGGAIYVSGGPVVRIRGTVFERNKAEWGGALYAEVGNGTSTVDGFACVLERCSLRHTFVQVHREFGKRRRCHARPGRRGRRHGQLHI